ncbi:rCG24825 [Rattus norvegicus]|uniref:RCG24825 n=1 Tax=Rattus norvegicus TaxID=10116 RepID=A6JBV1_RAT|nr:rCG24825 [Rattus norvegicus]
MEWFELEPRAYGLVQFFAPKVTGLLVDQKLFMLALLFPGFLLVFFFLLLKKSILIGDFDIDIIRVGKSLRRHKVIVFY